MKNLLFFALLLPAAVSAGGNLVPNGSFEDGVKHWSYEEWKGLPPPGRIEEGKAADGKKFFALTDPGTTVMRFIRTSAFPVDRSKTYVVRFRLAGENLKKGSVEVKILQYAPPVERKTEVLGWVFPCRPGVANLLPQPLEGSFPWRKYELELPGSVFHGRASSAAIYFQHLSPSFGELWIDAVEVTEK